MRPSWPRLANTPNRKNPASCRMRCHPGSLLELPPWRRHSVVSLPPSGNSSSRSRHEEAEQNMRVHHPWLLAWVFMTCVAGIASSQTRGPVQITLDEAIQLALQHNHNLLAARTTIRQSEAQEITAKLRPNPVLGVDAQFLPIFEPSKFSEDYINNNAQFDL